MNNDYEGEWEDFKSKIRKEFSKNYADNVEGFIAQIEPGFVDYFSGHRDARKQGKGAIKLITRIVNQLDKIVNQAGNFVSAHEKADNLRGDLHDYLSGSRIGFGFDMLNDFIGCELSPSIKDVRPPEGEETHDNDNLNVLLEEIQSAIQKIVSTRNKLIKGIDSLEGIDERAKFELVYFSKIYSPRGTPILGPRTILDAVKELRNKYRVMKEEQPLIECFQRAWINSLLPKIETGINSNFIAFLAMALGYANDGNKLKSLAQQYQEICNSQKSY